MSKRYFRIDIWGYGAEVVIGEVTRDQYNFWKEEKEKYDEGEQSLVEELYDDWHSPKIPKEMKMEAYDWYETDEILHASGPYLSGATIQVTEVESSEYQAPDISDILYEIRGEDEIEEKLPEWEWGENDETYPLDMPDHPYVFMGVSEEKGTFYSSAVEEDGDFDLNKLKLVVEDIDGGYMIAGVKYGDQEVDMELDTNGKALNYYWFSSEE